MEDFTKVAAMLEKIAAGDVIDVPVPPQTKEDHERTTRDLEALFSSREGLAQNSKKDLSRYFDTKNPVYTMRSQSLIEKCAQVNRLR
jgi:hypothetical protein